MAKRASKLKLFEEIQEVLQVPDTGIELIPNGIRNLVEAVKTPPTSVTIARNSVGQVSISTAGHPQTPEAFLGLADMMNKVATKFRETAVEVAKNVGDQEEVGTAGDAHRNDEQGNGPSADNDAVANGSAGSDTEGAG